MLPNLVRDRTTCKNMTDGLDLRITLIAGGQVTFNPPLYNNIHWTPICHSLQQKNESTVGIMVLHSKRYES